MASSHLIGGYAQALLSRGNTRLAGESGEKIFAYDLIERKLIRRSLGPRLVTGDHSQRFWSGHRKKKTSPIRTSLERGACLRFNILEPIS